MLRIRDVIPDPGVKKAPDSGSGSETRMVTYIEDEMFIPYGITRDKNTSMLILDARLWICRQLIPNFLPKGISYIFADTVLKISINTCKYRYATFAM
jgi:hypothetical protein